MIATIVVLHVLLNDLFYRNLFAYHILDNVREFFPKNNCEKGYEIDRFALHSSHI